MILTMLASDSFNRHTLPPHQGANRRIRHHPPVNSRLPFNGLAQSELRRIFCSDEGALMRIFQPRLWSPKGLLTSPPFLDRSDAWVAVFAEKIYLPIAEAKNVLHTAYHGSRLHSWSTKSSSPAPCHLAKVL